MTQSTPLSTTVGFPSLQWFRSMDPKCSIRKLIIERYSGISNERYSHKKREILGLRSNHGEATGDDLEVVALARALDIVGEGREEGRRVPHRRSPHHSAFTRPVRSQRAEPGLEQDLSAVRRWLRETDPRHRRWQRRILPLPAQVAYNRPRGPSDGHMRRRKLERDEGWLLRFRSFWRL